MNLQETRLIRGFELRGDPGAWRQISVLQCHRIWRSDILMSGRAQPAARMTFVTQPPPARPRARAPA